MVAMRQDARVYKALALRVLLCSPVRRRILPGPVVWRYLRRCLPFCTLCEGGDLLGPQFEGVPKLGRALHDEGAVETGQHARRPLQAPGRTPQERPSFRLLEGEPHWG